MRTPRPRNLDIKYVLSLLRNTDISFGALLEDQTHYTNRSDMTLIKKTVTNAEISFIINIIFSG